MPATAATRNQIRGRRTFLGPSISDDLRNAIKALIPKRGNESVRVDHRSPSHGSSQNEASRGPTIHPRILNA
jgi:hypothetical protein